MATVYEVTAHRDGRWWVFEIPGLTSPSPRGAGHRIVAMGQSGKAADVARAARDVAGLWLDCPADDITVSVKFQIPQQADQAIRLASERDQAGRCSIQEAAGLRRQAVRALIEDGLTQADAATILGVSRQRVSQLVAG